MIRNGSRAWILHFPMNCIMLIYLFALKYLPTSCKNEQKPTHCRRSKDCSLKDVGWLLFWNSADEAWLFCITFVASPSVLVSIVLVDNAPSVSFFCALNEFFCRALSGSFSSQKSNAFYLISFSKTLFTTLLALFDDRL